MHNGTFKNAVMIPLESKCFVEDWHRYVLSPSVLLWLEENVGKEAKSAYAYMRFEELRWTWEYGYQRDGETRAGIFYFKDREKAMFFKLAFGGL